MQGRKRRLGDPQPVGLQQPDGLLGMLGDVVLKYLKSHRLGITDIDVTLSTDLKMVPCFN